MAQNKEEIKKIAELNALFLSLEDKGQDSALIILRSLSFAQSVMCTQKNKTQSPKNHPL